MSDRQTSITLLRQHMQATRHTLQKLKLGKRRGRAALDALPWYLVLGNAGTGKSSMITHAGLTFPFAEARSDSGTAHCDWFVASEALLIDTAGRYVTQSQDKPEWLELLKILKAARAPQPINGVIVTASFFDLMTSKNADDMVHYARQIRERIQEIDLIFGIKIPVYVMFTKMDLLAGFSQFFAGMSEEERQQVWGATLPHELESGVDIKSVVEEHVEQLYRGLMQRGDEQLAHPGQGPGRRAAHFTFPIEFYAVRHAIGKFISLLGQDDPHQGRPLLRGFYFTSAQQEGKPYGVVGERIATRFDLSSQGLSVAEPVPGAHSFFLGKLFRDVLFADQHLVNRTFKPSNRRVRLGIMAIGLTILTVVVGAFTWSYVGNQKLIAIANEELTVAHGLSESPELVDKLMALQVLQLRIEQLERYRKQGHPLMLGLSLYQGDKVERSLRATYFAGVKTLMLNPVQASLEQSLAELQPTAPVTSVAQVAPAPVAAVPAVTTTAATVATTAATARPADASAASGKASATTASKSKAPTTASATVAASTSTPTSAISAAPVTTAVTATAATAATATATATAASNKSPEDGYNALKTYLMLQQKNRMEAFHLSDQIPKYWRTWLEANKGNGSLDDISRLAERAVAFYVSQIGAADLPTIDNRADLIAHSRAVLVGNMHMLSPKERVYNELKSRANIQFAPITVGRILSENSTKAVNNASATANNGTDRTNGTNGANAINGDDIRVVAGSYAVPGAFTREAWEQYFDKAITAAGKGEVKGDDWVLGISMKDDLSRNGDAVHNRAELEVLYKAEYAAAWKKFLQGVAIQKFGSLDNTGKALEKLSDAQNSGIKLILVNAAYETTWDNQKAAGASGVQVGELGGKFTVLSTMTSPGPDGRMPLATYLDMLARLKGRLSQMTAGGQNDGVALKLMQDTLNGNGSELSSALTMVDSVLLANAADDTKELIRPILVRPLIQTYAALIPVAQDDINRAWQTEVMVPWHALSNKYPFADSANEAPLVSMLKFIKARDGIVSNFVDKDLSGLASKKIDTLTPRTWANMGIDFNPSFLTSVARFSAAGSDVMQEGASVKFELQFVPTPGLSGASMVVDGQTLDYQNAAAWTPFSWPGANQNAAGVKLQATSSTGATINVASFSGHLGLLHLMEQAKTTTQPGGIVQLEWKFKPVRGAAEKAAAGASASASTTTAPGEASADTVRVNLRMVSGPSPVLLSGLRHIDMPEKITN